MVREVRLLKYHNLWGNKEKSVSCMNAFLHTKRPQACKTQSYIKPYIRLFYKSEDIKISILYILRTESVDNHCWGKKKKFNLNGLCHHMNNSYLIHCALRKK